MATISWERLANIDIYGLNLKISTVAFSAALVLTVFDSLHLRTKSRPTTPVLGGAFVVILAMLLAVPFAYDSTAALKQLTTVIFGAFVPLVVIVLHAHIYRSLDLLLTSLIRGAWIASSFGLYQLFAFYTGLPQFIAYTDTSGGLGRISAFNYEAAYFGYFLVLVIGALFARSALRGEGVHRGHLAFFIVVLVVANSRATFLTIPLLFIFIFASWPERLTRTRLWPAVTLAFWGSLLLLLIRPTIASSFISRATSIFDPTEASSNLPRLTLYETSINIIRDNFVFGVGPGNLIYFASRYGLVTLPDATSNSVIANNVWLQALLDGGPILLLAELILVIVAVVTLYRGRLPVARQLMAGWLATFLVSSMITSYYFNTALWVVLGLAAAAASFSPEGDKLICLSLPSKRADFSRSRRLGHSRV